MTTKTIRLYENHLAGLSRGNLRRDLSDKEREKAVKETVATIYALRARRQDSAARAKG